MLFTQRRSIKSIPKICLFYEIFTVFAKAMKGTIDQFIKVVYIFFIWGQDNWYTIKYKPFQNLV